MNCRKYTQYFNSFIVIRYLRSKNWLNCRRLAQATNTTSQVKDPTYPTIQELSNRLRIKFGVEAGYRPIPSSREYLMKYTPKLQHLPPRSMQDSFLVGIIPLSTEQVLQDKYTTFLGQLRVSRLLEDMDIFAVMVAEKHIFVVDLPKNLPLPYTLVTVLVDQIDFTDYVPKPTLDVKLSGHVSWVGVSSMEVVVWLEQNMHGQWNKITRALFLIAARNAINKGAAIVNPLNPANKYEQHIFNGGGKRKERRIKTSSKEVFKTIPTSEEQLLIHELYLKNLKLNVGSSIRETKLPRNFVPMNICKLSKSLFSQPEDRNLHNNVFGGFLMRHAVDLGWIVGYRFCKHRPKIFTIGNVTFHRPISVYSLIHMDAAVVYSTLQYVQIVIFVEVFDPTTGGAERCNTIHVTLQACQPIKEVFPFSYHEAMLFIEGKRHLQRVIETRREAVEADRGPKRES